MSRILSILFNTDTVRAILDGKKTVTRRVIKGYVPADAVFEYNEQTPKGYISGRGKFWKKQCRLPYQPGDILYVRETWAFMPCIGCNGEYARPGVGMACYDMQAVEYDDGDSISDGCFVYRADCKNPERICWRPSVHMPKEAARIWLKVTDVKVEQLQDITTWEAKEEGAGEDCIGMSACGGDCKDCPAHADNYIPLFKKIWNSTIKGYDIGAYDWDANPWVWVVEFERCEKPEGGTAKRQQA
ncbi:MAG: hypothetical protein NC434_10995 [Ruminococcus sp.]|nr:hypothetical protein [Ruminococcus sp.]